MVHLEKRVKFSTMLLRNFLRHIISNRLLGRSANIDEWLRTQSIRAAVREQKLSAIYDKLKAVVPDITHQYSSFDLDTEYLQTNVRAMHAFQVSLINEAINPAQREGSIPESEAPSVPYT